jgi:hypothetical protein
MLLGVKYVRWEIVLGRISLNEAQIEVQEYDKIYRGPIKQVVLSGDDVRFELIWCAYFDLATDKWTAADRPTAAIMPKNNVTIMTQKDNLRYVITSPTGLFIVATIDMKGGYRLDPEKVIDLDLKNLPKPEVTTVD